MKENYYTHDTEDKTTPKHIISIPRCTAPRLPCLCPTSSGPPFINNMITCYIHRYTTYKTV